LSQGKLPLAEECDILDDFNCTGGLLNIELGNEDSDASGRRLLHDGLLETDKYLRDIGLEVPILSEPLNLLGLFVGNDIILFEYEAPIVAFGFDYTLAFTL
jgi:hypothetical protein